MVDEINDLDVMGGHEAPMNTMDAGMVQIHDTKWFLLDLGFPIHHPVTEFSLGFAIAVVKHFLSIEKCYVK